MNLSFSNALGPDVRVRFCPSPTGNPHVGLIRTALFNWAYAKHHGGKFVFRIEDTDLKREDRDSYRKLLDAMRWLNLEWDEGVEVGGPHGPYRQSERKQIYDDLIQRLLQSGHLYESYVTAEEMAIRNESLGRDAKQGYDNHERELPEAKRKLYRDEGRRPALRLRAPELNLAFEDLVRGDITFPAAASSDFVVVRADGTPLYTFVNPVDDALMKISHVLRGEDLLSSTPRQIAVYMALHEIGFAHAIPRFAHLPYVMGEGKKKLSKRDPESDLAVLREKGFIREGLLNYLALLGWSIAPDNDVFSMPEMVELFDVTKVNPNPARFDLKKAVSINGDHIRLLSSADFLSRCVPFFQRRDLVSTPPSEFEEGILQKISPLVQPRVSLLSEAVEMMEFLFVSDDKLVPDDGARKTLDDKSPVTLKTALTALDPLESWEAGKIEGILRKKLIEELGLPPRKAFGPLRTAISGRTVSPPLFESMEALGRLSVLARLRALHDSI